MAGQPVWPCGGGFNRLHEMYQEDEGIVDAALLGIAQRGAIIMKVHLKMRGLFPWQLEGEGKVAVPHARMMGGGVSQDR